LIRVLERPNNRRVEKQKIIQQEFIDAWYGRVFAFCQSQLRSRCDAEDAAQETFMRAIRFQERIAQSETVGAWLRSVAKHVCIDAIRRNQRRECDALPNDALVPSLAQEPSVLCSDRDEQQLLVQMIHQLDEDLREVVLLHYYDELTYDQIANWLDVARSTVNERLARARKTLKAHFNNDRYRDEVH
jgi:RNA polymerase sigma-70 factor, ECF subfamily